MRPESSDDLRGRDAQGLIVELEVEGSEVLSEPVDATERVDLLLRDLRASRAGLSFIVWGADELRRYIVRARGIGAST